MLLRSCSEVAQKLSAGSSWSFLGPSSLALRRWPIVLIPGASESRPANSRVRTTYLTRRTFASVLSAQSWVRACRVQAPTSWSTQPRRSRDLRNVWSEGGSTSELEAMNKNFVANTRAEIASASTRVHGVLSAQALRALVQLSRDVCGGIASSALASCASEQTLRSRQRLLSEPRNSPMAVER